MRQLKQTIMLCLLWMAGMALSAQDFDVDGIYYNVINMSELTCEVTSGASKYSGDVVIPEVVTLKSRDFRVIAIGENSFKDCYNLNSVSLNNNITAIKQSAFSGCSGIVEIGIPKSVTSIGDNTFANCSCLTKVVVSWDSPISISSSVFSGCPSVCKLFVPYGTKKAYSGWGGFSTIEEYQTGLAKSISLSQSNITVTEGEMKHLHIQVLPEKGTSRKFAWESNDSSVAIAINGRIYGVGEGTAAITVRTTDGSNLTALCKVSVKKSESPRITPLTTAEIEPWEGVYYYESSYNAADPASDWYKIGYDDSEWTDFTGSLSNKGTQYCPENTSWKGEYDAYWIRRYFYINSLEDADRVSYYLRIIHDDDATVYLNGTQIYQLGNNITSYATVQLPNPKLSEGENVIAVKCTNRGGYDAYIDFGLDRAVDNFLFGVNSAGEVCVKKYYGSAADVEIPSSMSFEGNEFHVNAIGNDAFSNNTSLVNVTIPSSITSIGQSAFNGCKNLSSLEIPNSVTKIESNAFSGCSGLRYICLGNGLTDMSTGFSWNSYTNLAELIIGKYIKSVPDLSNCPLSFITVKAQTPPTATAFKNSSYIDAEVTVPVGCLDAYMSAKVWKDFFNIVESNDDAGKTALLIVHQKNGEKTTFAFSDSPKVVKKDDVLLLTTSKISVEYPLGDVDKFTFDFVATSIKELQIATENVTDGRILVYDTLGHLVKTFNANDNNKVSLNTDELPSGIYIVKSGTNSYKILKR